MDQSAPYHVDVLLTSGELNYLGELPLAKPHHSSLDPYVSRLVREGQAGLVRLVDRASGAVLARRRFPSPRRVTPPG